MNENNNEEDNIGNEENNNSDNESNAEDQDLGGNKDDAEDQNLTKDENDADDLDSTKDENKTDFKDGLKSGSLQGALSVAQNLSRQLGSALSGLQLDFTPLVQTLANNIQNINLSPSLTEAIKNIQNFPTVSSTIVQSPVMQWLQNFDYSPLYQLAQQVANFINPETLRRALYGHLYETHWFPGLLYNAELSLMAEIIEIVGHTRTVKSETKKVDKVIFDYYTKKRIEDIRKSWREFNVPGYIIRILRDGVQAYYGKQYAVTVIVLASLWERIICDKFEEDSWRKISKTSEKFHVLIEQNNDPEIINSYYDDFIMYNCNSKDETKSDSPGRHSAAHGFFNRYPTRKAALNAILFTDFLIRLQPSQE